MITSELSAAPAKRFAGSHAGRYLWLAHVPALVLMLFATSLAADFAALSARGGLQAYITLGAILGLVALVADMAVTGSVVFRLDRDAFPLRRCLAVWLLGLGAFVGVFVTVSWNVGEEPAVGLLAGAVAASCAAWLLVTFAKVAFAYREVRSVMEPARPFAGIEERMRLADPELAAIAGGEWLRDRLLRARLGLFGFLGVYAVLLTAGLISTGGLGMGNGDGTSRVAQAFYAVFSRDAHLGALGLIWAPLPALTNIPLVVLLRPFGDVLLAAPIMGAFYASIAVCTLFAIAREVGCGRGTSLLLAATFLTYQHLYQSAAAGLSEAPLATFLLLSLLMFLRWLRTSGQQYLLFAGTAAAAAVMCRYEALFWVAAQALGAALVLLLPSTRTRMQAGGRAGSAMSVGMSSVLAYGLPSVFALGMWMIVNADIKGNPIYFLVGAGSTREAPDTVGKALEQFLPTYGYHSAAETVYASYHSLSGTIDIVLSRAALISPLLLVLTPLLLLLAVVLRDLKLLVIVGLAWSVLAFTALSGYIGALPPWYRYWYWMHPMGLVLAAVALGRLGARPGRIVATLLLVLLAVVPNVRAWDASARAFEVPEGAPPNTRLRNALFTNEDLGSVEARQASTRELRAAAALVNQHARPGAIVLSDISGGGAAITVFADRPEDWVTATDRGFEVDYLERVPQVVDFLLIPRPTFDVLTRSIVLQTYPEVWEERTPWAELVAEAEGPSQWRLFRIRRAE